ncbi:MAG: hypothetical protein WAK60_04655 [Sedimentisphaerales bacterium]
MAAVKTVSKPMSMADIKEKAKYLGISSGNMKKIELIHSIQRAEGNNACYGTCHGQCQWTNCCFRPDCLKIR